MKRLVVLLLTMCGPTAVAQDWPQWRRLGPDCVVHGVTVLAKWPRTLKEEWKVGGGEGVASPVVVGGQVFVFTGKP
jgi:hypothetical protein